MKVEKIYNKYAKGYSTGEFAPTTYKSRAGLAFGNDITWYFLKKYAPKKKTARILDAGAGNGDWTEQFLKLGYKDITLTDISQGMLDEAKLRLAPFKTNLQYIKSDISKMKEIESDHFDYVFSQYDAVSYCLKPKQAMKALARVAKKGAFVVVSLDTKFRRVPELIEAGQFKQLKSLIDSSITYDFGHPQYNLTWEELAMCFEQAGLEVVEVIGAPVFMQLVSEETLQKINNDPKLRKMILDIEMQHCTNRSLVNFAGHLQMVGRKK